MNEYNDLEFKYKSIDSMEKEDLIKFVKDIKEARAFTYHDRMLLEFIDKSFFSVWASDRDCKITFWAGKSESVYQYSENDVLGKDFIDKFVAKGEQGQARKDLKDIIEHGAVCRNVAYDINASKDEIPLLTHCFRIHDIKTQAPWQAEMGLKVDLEEELRKLKQAIKRSDDITKYIEEFDETIDNQLCLFKEKIADHKTKSRHPDDLSEKTNKILQPFSIRAEELKVQMKECLRTDNLDHCKLLNQNINELCGEFIEKLNNEIVNKRFKIALSFAGEFRDTHIQPLVEKLEEFYAKNYILYDLFLAPELARIDADTYMQSLYTEDSDLLVFFFSKEYAQKKWCKLEWRAIRSIIKDRQDDVMPIRLDDVDMEKIEGLFASADGWIDFQVTSEVDRVFEAIKKRYKPKPMPEK